MCARLNSLFTRLGLLGCQTGLYLARTLPFERNVLQVPTVGSERCARYPSTTEHDVMCDGLSQWVMLYAITLC